MENVLTSLTPSELKVPVYQQECEDGRLTVDVPINPFSADYRELRALIREWYFIGRRRAVLANKEKGKRYINRMNLLQGMALSLWSEDIHIGEHGDLSKFAFVPNRRHGQREEGEGAIRILLGLYSELINQDGRKFIGIRGVKDTWWVKVPIEMEDSIRRPSSKKLIAVRAIRRKEMWVLFDVPVEVQLSSPDAMWAESEYHAQAYSLMLQRNLSVDIPSVIRYDLGGVRPDFVVTGLQREVLVEVYASEGGEGVEEYRKRLKALFDNLQQRGVVEFLYWDVHTKNGRKNFIDRLNTLA